MHDCFVATLVAKFLQTETRIRLSFPEIGTNFSFGKIQKSEEFKICDKVLDLTQRAFVPNTHLSVRPLTSRSYAVEPNFNNLREALEIMARRKSFVFSAGLFNRVSTA